MDEFGVVVDELSIVTNAWQAQGVEIAQQIFLALALLQIVWSTILWMLNKDNPNELFLEFIQKMLILSIFWFLIGMMPNLVNMLLESFTHAATKIANVNQVGPVTTIERGLYLSGAILKETKRIGWMSEPITALTIAVVAFLILFAFLRVAIELILVVFGSKIVLFGGLIMLGFSGSKWTFQYAERYFSTAMHFAIKLFFIIIIIGFGDSFASTWAEKLAVVHKNELFNYCLVMMCIAITYAYLAISIPTMAASMLASQFAIGLGDPIRSAIGGLSSAAKFEDHLKSRAEMLKNEWRQPEKKDGSSNDSGGNVKNLAKKNTQPNTK